MRSHPLTRALRAIRSTLAAAVVIAGLGGAFASSARGAVVAHWSFDSGTLALSGGNITAVSEQTGNHNATVQNGTFAAATDSVTGQFGQGLRFGGNNNLQFTNLTELMQASGAPSYTVSLWIQWPTTATAPGGATPFATFGNWGNGGAGTANVSSRFTFGFGPNAAGTMRGQTRSVSTTTGDGTDIYAETSPAANINNNVWHMLTWTFNPTTGAMNAYYDGVLAESITSAALNKQMANSTSAIASMGLKADTNTFLTADVRLDEVWVFNEVLSAADVASLFSANAVPEPTSLALFGIGALGLLRRRRAV